MAYIVNNTRGQIIAVIQDGTINTTATSQTLVGKNVTPYGEFSVENIVHQLENFANDVPPLNPLVGQIWYNIVESQLYAYSEDGWKPVDGQTVSTSEPTVDPKIGDIWYNPTTQLTKIYGPTTAGFGWISTGKVTVATSTPPGVAAGELYFNTATKQLFAYDGTVWNLIGPEGVAGFGTTRWISTTLPDTTNAQHAVILGYVSGVIQSIISTDAFTIASNSRPEGFVTLVAGINLKTGSVLSGRATYADQFTTPRTINGVVFDGTQNIQIGTAGNLQPGGYILGSAWNGRTTETWSVAATPANTANYVVARNSSGDFAARRITANLIGDVTGNATNVTGVVSYAHGGTGFTTYQWGDLLTGSISGNGALVKARIVDSEYIKVVPAGVGTNNFTLSYVGGAGVGNVTSVGITAGEGIGVSGSPITSSGNITVTNAGVVRLNAGTGVSVDRTNGNVTVSSTGPTRLIAGTGVTLSPSSGVGDVTINATPGVTGVTQIVAGDNVTISPPSGTGVVTISSTGGGGGGGGTVTYAGTIQMWAGSTPPTGWALCDGSAVSRSTYSTLFSRLGTTYGPGNGTTTFNLPDMRGLLGIGASNTLARNVYGALAISSYPVMDFTNPDSYVLSTFTQEGLERNTDEITVDRYDQFGGSTWPAASGSGTSPAALTAPPGGDAFVAVFGYPKAYNTAAAYRRALTSANMASVAGSTQVSYYINKGTPEGWGQIPDSSHGERMRFQYSLYDGAHNSWVDLDVVETDVAANTWIQRTVTLPAAIINNPTHVKFRFYMQGEYSAGSAYVDTWAVTNPVFNTGNASTTSFETSRLVAQGAVGTARSTIGYLSNYWIICLDDVIGGGGGGGAVNRIIAGNNITVSPGGGTGDVTISSTGGSGGQSVSNNPPTNPNVADLWYDIGDTGRLYVWTGFQWVDASPAGGFNGVGTLLQESGYTTLPSGVIIQWGKVAMNYNQTEQEFSYVIPFPHQCFNVQATVQTYASTSGTINVYVKQFDKSKFTLIGDYTKQTNPGSFAQVMAIGY